MENPRLFLLDAYALIFRAYYALIRSPQFTRDGFNTSAVFGFVNTLEELLKKENPSHIAVCFDPPGPTFRHKMLDTYKGERESTPEDIKLSVPIIKEIIKAYRIPLLEVDGYEADDVIGTMADKAAQAGYTVYIMSPDKDFGQLVNSQVLQYKPSYRGQDFEIRGEKEICERYGLENTSQIIDLLALMGDKADNIPGCPGIGEKTAVKLIGEFHSVENLIASVDSLKGALHRKVTEGVEQIMLSKDLATIRKDVPVDIEPEDLRVLSPDTGKLFAVFKEMEFNRLAQRVRKRLDSEREDTGLSLFSQEEEPGDIAEVKEMPIVEERRRLPQEKFHTVYSKETLEELKRRLASAHRIGFYMNCMGDSDYASRWLGSAVCFDDGECFYLPSSDKECEALMLDILARPDILKITSASKRDYVVAALRRQDSEIPLASYYDITIAHYLLQPELRHDLPELASGYLGMELPSLPDQSKMFVEEETGKACCSYAFATLMLHDPIDKEIADGDFSSLLSGVELPLVPVLAGMELEGVRIDVGALNQAAEEMSKNIAGIENRIYDEVGMRFKIDSPAQVGEVLFDVLKLDPKAKKTKTGKYSTSEAVLDKLVSRHPVVSLILQYRGLKKLLTTYLTSLPGNIDPASGKIHTNYNQTVTATGRISSSGPNLQNIPVRTDVGREIRKAFIADPGCVFLSADYSQIELRLVADLSQDATMIDAFCHNKDIHALTAAKIYEIPVEEVSDDQRRNAKTANFGILYGISPFGLSSRLGISRAEAKMLIDGYHAMFPSVSRYMEETLEKARSHGYVQTIFGRKRMQPDINSANAVVRGYAERNAINAPVQGSAADIIKRAMVDIDAEIRQRKLRSKMIMQVHDELNFNVPEEEIEIMRELVVRNMENAHHGAVRLTASCGVGSNWLEAH